jgi:hypothetical protein
VATVLSSFSSVTRSLSDASDPRRGVFRSGNHFGVTGHSPQNRARASVISVLTRSTNPHQAHRKQKEGTYVTRHTCGIAIALLFLASAIGSFLTRCSTQSSDGTATKSSASSTQPPARKTSQSPLLMLLPVTLKSYAFEPHCPVRRWRNRTGLNETGGPSPDRPPNTHSADVTDGAISRLIRGLSQPCASRSGPPRSSS